jgi:hypothetical protein
MWKAISSWFAKQGGFSHVVAGVWSSAFIAYAAVPPFHQFVIDVWAKTPSGLHEAIPAVAGLVGWYTSTHKTPAKGPNEV